MMIKHFGSILQCRWECASLSILQVLQRVLRRHRVDSRLIFGSVGIKNKSVCHESLKCLLLVRVLVCCQHVHLSLLDELVKKLVSNQRFHHLCIVFKPFTILHDVLFLLLSTAEQFRHGFPEPEILPFSISSDRHELANPLQQFNRIVKQFIVEVCLSFQLVHHVLGAHSHHLSIDISFVVFESNLPCSPFLSIDRVVGTNLLVSSISIRDVRISQ